MKRNDTNLGRTELQKARAENRRLFWIVGLFSVFVNLLMLTGPLFMLQIYDRVLSSRSEATLVALVVLMAFLFLMMGLLDFARGRVLARIGARFQSRLDRRVFAAMVRKAAIAHDGDAPQNNLRDLESVQRLFSSPVLSAFFDMPWTPVFLAAIAIFHPWLGALALAGGAVLVVVAIVNQRVTAAPVREANQATLRADRMADQIRTEAEMVRSLGMQDAAFARWADLRNAALRDTISASDLGGGFSATSRTFRLFLQSAILGLGAWLVLQGELTAGAMIAASILLGRALAPIDMALGQWQLVQRAMEGWRNLATLLGTVPQEPQRTALRMVSFDVQPGEAVGVIGPSGAGKSTLARAVVGVWRPSGGKIRLDGAALEQYEPDVLGRHIGYLPQRVQLFDGSIAQNIARLDPDASDADIVAAARKADAHEMILQLPDGYDSRVTAAGGRLSGGQIQRIGLARALFGDPVLLVLDEPNSNLDNKGSEALNNAIREMKQQGKSVMIMAHRPAAIRECDRLLVLEDGMRRAFGPRDEVLRETVQNHAQIGRTAGGVT